MPGDSELAHSGSERVRVDLQELGRAHAGLQCGPGSHPKQPRCGDASRNPTSRHVLNARKKRDASIQGLRSLSSRLDSHPGRPPLRVFCLRRESRLDRSPRRFPRMFPGQRYFVSSCRSAGVGARQTSARIGWLPVRRNAGLNRRCPRGRSRKGGRRIGKTAMRYQRSSRKVPSLTISDRSRCVAATTRTSTRIGCSLPTRSM